MIELKNVSVVFNGKHKAVEAVSNIDLKINDGEVFGIVGSSGAGKSTLVRTINLLQRPTSGKVIIDGEDVTLLKGEALRKVRLKIGMIFQHFNLISGKTVYGNIEFVLKANNYPKDKRKEKIEELLRVVGLTEKAHVFPSQLSGGQKQRVGIARALANNPEILLCDEATSALDMETTVEILNLLGEINRKYGITIVFITHQLEVAKRLFHRLAVMSEGKIVEINDAYSIFSDPKEAATKSLIEKDIRIELPKQFEDLTKGIELYKIYYTGETSISPLISSVSKKVDAYINILHGKIEYVNDKPIGILLISITGEDGEVRKAKQYIKENVSRMEEIKVG